MKLKQLECMVAIVQNGFSVTVASETLHMSQPAVSKQIKLFEESLGMSIFKRSRKTFTGLTPLGEEILPEIDKILASVENIKRLGKYSQEARFSQFNIATTNTLAQYQLSSKLPNMHAKYPNLPMNIIEGTNLQVLAMLAEHEADFGWFSALDLQHYQNALRGLIYIPAMKWSPVLVVPKDHPLAQSGPKSLKDLGDFPLVTYVTSHKGPSGLVTSLYEAGVAARIAVTSRNADMIKNYVRQGLGIGVIADIAYNKKSDSDLVMWKLNQWLADFQTYLAWHEEKRLRDVHYDFISQVIPSADKKSVQNYVRRLFDGESEGWVI